MRDVLGITGAAPVWHDAMEELFRSEELLVSFGSGDYPPFAFTEPAGIVRAPICDRAADSIGAGCATRTEAFAADHRTGDVGAAFDTFLLRRIDPGDGAGSLQCAVRDLQGSRMLLPPHRGDLAAQVRHWATAGGYRVAPPLCSEVSDAGSGAPHPAVAAAPGPSRSAKP
jgi:hypothetical protein